MRRILSPPPRVWHEKFVLSAGFLPARTLLIAGVLALVLSLCVALAWTGTTLADAQDETATERPAKMGLLDRRQVDREKAWPPAALAVDPDGGTIAWSLEGADAGMFTLSGGGLSPKASPDYEDNKSSYSATVKATAGNKSTTRTMTATVTDVPESPTITGPATVTYGPIPSRQVATYSAVDEDGAAVNNWSLPEGADKGKFSISSAGVLTFTAQPSRLTADDANGDFKYQVTVRAQDGSNRTADRAVTVTINRPPAMDESLFSRSISIAENWTGPVVSLPASDPDGDTISWSVDGTDASHFKYTWLSPYGNNLWAHDLTFIQVPEFDLGPNHPHWDADRNHVYEFNAVVADRFGGRSYPLTVTVTNVNEPPKLFGRSTITREEGSSLTVASYTAADPEGQPVQWSLSGTDAGDFEISSGGVLTFASAPSFDSPADADTDNVYDVTVEAADSTAKFRTLAVTVTLTEDTGAFRISGGQVSHWYAENGTAVIETFTATDPQNRTTSWSLEGADAGDFSIGSGNGQLSFASSPDFESPTDADMDNVYNVTVKATTGTDSATRAVTVTVTGVDEPVTFISGSATVSKEEGGSKTVETYMAKDPDRPFISWSLEGEDQNDFTIAYHTPTDEGGSATLSFKVVPDFDSPTDSDGDNVYKVTVRAADESEHDPDLAKFAVTVKVTAVDQAPTITGGATNLSFTENATGTVATYTASDPEGDTITWSVEGTDGNAFNISSSGALTFKSPPDYDTKSSYSITVKATANGKSATRDVTVTIANAANLTGPGRVTGLQATATAHNRVSLSWHAPSDGTAVTGYRILRRAADTENSLQIVVQNTRTTGTAWTDDDVSARTKYVYRVQALGEHGEGQVAQPASVITPHAPKPGRVTGLEATATVHNRVSLSWHAPSDGAAVTGYRVLRRAADTENSLQVVVQDTGTTDTAWTDDDVSARTKYVYRVQALGEHDEGEVAQPASVITPHAPKPGRVTGLEATATAHNRVSLSWHAPSDGAAVTGYRILRRAADTENSLQVVVQDTGATDTAWTDEDVSARTKYVYRVQALGEHGEGQVAQPATVTTPG